MQTVMKSLVYFLLIALFPLSGWAQEDTCKSSPDAPSWAMQFQIGENFKLSSFQGATISLQKYLANSKALRFGLSISGNLFDNLNKEDKNFNGTSSNLERKVNSFGIRLNTQYLKYFRNFSKTSFYIGGGPLVFWNMYNRKNKNTYKDTTGTVRPGTDQNLSKHSLGFGVSLVSGVSIAITKRVYLSGEYGMILDYEYSKSSDKRITYSGTENVEWKSNTTQKSILFKNDAIKFGVTILF